jgi:DNA-binding GntR family transcriptional regulator
MFLRSMMWQLWDGDCSGQGWAAVTEALMNSGEPEGWATSHSDAGGVSDSLHHEVLTRLRDFIVEGHLKPGERIPERQLCEKFAVSRTPLREALKVLASEQLVELLPNRGARIRAFSAADIRDFFEVLAALESAAGRLACDRISDQEIAEVERLHFEMYGHYMRRELPGYFRLNQAIHERIMAASGNQALKAAYRSFTSRMRQQRYSANTLERDRWDQAVREHEAMVDALRRRSAQELGDILFLHLINKWRATQALAAPPSPAP